MCTRSYPEGSAYGEGADGVCDMDSSTENANSSDSLIPTRKARSRSVVEKSEKNIRGHMWIVCVLKVNNHCMWVPLICFHFLDFGVKKKKKKKSEVRLSLPIWFVLLVMSREEQFEDYGEGEDVDFTPSSPCPEEETRTNGFSDLGSSLPSRLVTDQWLFPQ